MASIADTRLDEYEPTELNIACRRCQRQATATTYALRARYGNLTLGELVRRVAADGNPPCQLAGVEGNVLCAVRPEEPPVEQWATVSHAQKGRWTCWLECGRRHAALKAASSCPEMFIVDVETLAMVFPWDFPIERLRTRLRCPGCGSELIALHWAVPEAPDPPAAPARAIARLPRLRGLKVIGGRV